MDNRTVGVIGGDETSRLLVEAGHRLGVRVAVLDKDGSSSAAGQIASLCLEGNAYDQPNKIFELQAISDLITVIQKTSIEPLKTLQQQKNFPIYPALSTIETTQNKLNQRQYLQQRDLPVPSCVPVKSIDDILNFANTHNSGYPIVLKSKFFMDSSANTANRMASELDYSINASSPLAGQNQYTSSSSASSSKRSITLYSDEDIVPAIEKLGGVIGDGDILDGLYVEEMVPFVNELAISIVKTKDDEIFSYPVIEFHRKLKTSNFATLGTLVIVPAQISMTIQQAAKEIAIRAVSAFSGVGVFTVEMYVMADDAVVINEVVARPHSSGLYTLHACDRSQYEMHLRAILGLPCYQPRLMVPATATIQIVSSPNLLEAKQCFQQLISRSHTNGTWYGKNMNQQQVGNCMGHVSVSAQDIYDLRDQLEQLLGLTEKEHRIPKRPSAVAIVIESESALTSIESTLNILRKFSISFEVNIISPYKTPTKLFTFAQSAIDRGVKVIIVLDSSPPNGHLSSMIASLTTLPVLAAAVSPSVGASVSLPSGFPVAKLGEGGMENCAFLAARVLAIHDKNLQQALEQHSIHEEELILRESDKINSGALFTKR